MIFIRSLTARTSVIIRTIAIGVIVHMIIHFFPPLVILFIIKIIFV